MKIKKIATAAAVVPLAVALASLNSSPPSAPAAAGVVATSSPTAASDGVGEKTTGPCPTTLDACPPEGCGGDPALNALKNRLDAPADDDAESWSLARVIKLNQRSPTGWSRKNSRDELEDLGEGTPVSLKGWLINAHAAALETCNCKVKGADKKDFHLNLVTVKPDATKDKDEAKDEAMDKSVVVEMSPRSRHEGWVLTRLKALSDVPTYVRVTGWLMFDSAHANFGHMPRATAWEVHPVTKFEVCVDTKAKCDAGAGWKLLEQVQ